MIGRLELIVLGDRGLSENGGGVGLVSVVVMFVRRRLMMLSSMLEVNLCYERVLWLMM